MQLHCKLIDGRLITIAVYDDARAVPITTHGEGVVVMPYTGEKSVSELLMQPAPEVDLIAYARAKRWAVEVGGITHEGTRYATDDRSKLLLSGAAAAAARDSTYQTPWFTADGTVQVLDAEGVTRLSEAVLEHVNGTFKTLAEIATLVAVSPPVITTTVEVDVLFEPTGSDPDA